MQLKSLKNVTAFDQAVVYKGAKLVIEAGEEVSFPADVAEMFLSECDGLVQEVKAEAIEAQFGLEEPIWIANVTGAPWLQSTITEQRYDRQAKRNVREQIPRENTEPFVVKRWYDPGMKEYQGQDGGLLGLNLFKRPVVLPPYKRLAVPMEIGRWMLRRDRQQMPTMQGCLIKSRRPSGFEPDESWDLDDMRDYLKFVSNGKEELGPSTAQVETRAKNRKNGAGVDHELRLAKRDLMKKLFYYLANPECTLPSKRKFEEWRKGAPLTEEEEFSMSDMAEWEKADTRAVNAALSEAKAAPQPGV